MGYYIICPFYMSDSRLSVRCEDCIRQFYSYAEKREYIKTFCENRDGWSSCPYAMALTEFYEREGVMTNTEREIERYKYIAESYVRENEKLRLRLSHQESRVKSLEMMCGYLSELSLDFDKEGEAKIDIKKLCAFFDKTKVSWGKSDKDFIVVSKCKKKRGEPS